jgi:type IV secretion system protein VirB10
VDTNNLNISSSPQGINNNQKSIGGKYINKLPIFIVGLFIFVIVICLLYATSLRNNEVAKKETAINYNAVASNTESVENIISDLKKESNIAPLQNNVILPTDQQIVANQTFQKMSSTDKFNELIQEEEYKEILRKKQNYQAALLSQTAVQTVKTQNQPNFPFAANNNFNSIYSMSHLPSTADINEDKILQDSINQAKSIMSSLASEQGDDNNANQLQNEKFLQQKNSYDYLNAKKSLQVSPYEVKAGTIIPGVLITGINSDLPGQILAQVRENIYDTATGKYLLIPQGSKLLGAYSANIQYGQKRVLIAFHRLIYPNGSTLDLEVMNGMDQEGYAGFEDKVNNHYLRIFSSAFIFSGITAGVAIANNDDGGSFRESDIDKMYAAIVSGIGQIAQEMLRKNMNIAPTIEIRPGYRFNIFITKDIILEPLPY